MTVLPLKRRKVTAVGSALMDLLIHEDDAFLQMLSKEKGGMTYADANEQDAILKKATHAPVAIPGGAACNTIVGIARLGGEAGLISKRGEDDYGRAYEDHLTGMGVKTNFYTSTIPTGRVLSIITPDAQRSMFTYLGASTELSVDEVTAGCFHGSGIAVIEGYLLFNRELMRASLDAAKAAGALTALDLASFEVVRSAMDVLPEIVKNDVDILIANEDEAVAYTGISDEIASLEALAEHVKIAVLKVGERGSFIAHKETIIQVDAVAGSDKSEIKDTTGAGDLWAAGFLYGLSNGFTLEESGRIGAACGYEVCRVVGPQIPDEGWDRIKNYYITAMSGHLTQQSMKSSNQ